MTKLEIFKKELGIDSLDLRKTETGRLMCVNMPIGSKNLFANKDVDIKGKDLIVLEVHPNKDETIPTVYWLTNSKLLGQEQILV